ncbi:hypothetical protein [Acaryochloris sp. 'Moss Beach']|uniref:hypothetical protein n=1 Tax=Acaryochloris sp. 'Moss Beach' TaxID=2740837 RepID=UPI001F380718|nr:hypothetical protein [Acaryochloris sp. 'Moss Beach']
MNQFWKPKPWQWGVAMGSMLWATAGCASPLINASPQNKPLKIAQVSRQKIADQGDIRIVYVQPNDANFNAIAVATLIRTLGTTHVPLLL